MDEVTEQASTTGNSYHQAPQAVVSAPSGCPVNHDWSPLNADYLEEPYAIASALREESPIFFSEKLGYVVVTRMEDVEEVFMNPDIYATGPSLTTAASACTPGPASPVGGFARLSPTSFAAAMS